MKGSGYALQKYRLIGSEPTKESNEERKKEKDSAKMLHALHEQRMKQGRKRNWKKE